MKTAFLLCSQRFLCFVISLVTGSLFTIAQNANPPPGCTNGEATVYVCSTNVGQDPYGYGGYIYSYNYGYGSSGYSSSFCTWSVCSDANDNTPDCMIAFRDDNQRSPRFGGGGSGPGRTAVQRASDAYCAGCGMPTWRVEEPSLSLYVSDVPLFYSTSRGRQVAFQLSYKGKPGMNVKGDNLQPAIFGAGTNWHTPWRSYMQKSTVTDASTGDPTFFIFLGDGSGRQYPLNKTEQHSRSSLLFTNGEYRLTFPSGGRNVYATFVTLGTNQYIFLSRMEDSVSNVLRFSYTFATSGALTNSVRLDKITDEDNREITFVYGTNAFYSNLISEVHGPYGLTATLAHDASARITGLTDIANLASTIQYDSEERISKVVTPYGTNSFAYFNTNGSTALLVDQLGLRKELYLAGHSRAGALSTAPSESVAANGFIGYYSTFETNGFETRNTFYWGPRQFQNLPSSFRSSIAAGSFDPANLTTNDLKLGRTRHWLRARTGSASDTNIILSSLLSVERAPSPDTNGATEGLLTWYDYAGKTDETEFNGKWEYATVFKMPTTIAYRLPGGDWQGTKYVRNSLGNPTRVEQTYSVRSKDPANVEYTWITAWRTNYYLYASNGVDLLSTHFAGTGAAIRLQSSNVFDAFHQVTTNYNALGEAAYYEYNSNHQLIKETFPSGLIVDYSYDANGFLTSIVERSLTQNLRTNSYTWTNGLVLTQTDPRGSTTTNTWDPLGRITRTANELGAVNYAFDKLDLVRLTDRMGYTNGFAYNGFRQLLRHTNANSATTTYEYCDCGALEGVLDAANNRTTVSYDNLGRPVRTTFADNTWVQRTYDLLNQPIEVSDSGGGSIFNTYLLGGLLAYQESIFGVLLRVFYDAEDRATNIIDGNGILTTRSFDALGRIVSAELIDYWDNPTWPPDWVTYTDRFGYSPRGLTAYTNALGQVSGFAYDELGRKTFETNALGEMIQLTFSSGGDLLSVTDAKGQTTSWKSDSHGRVTNKTDQAGATVARYTYDANHRLTSRWSPAKGTTTYSYDAAGNLLQVDYPSSVDVVMRYDALNRLTNMVDAVGTNRFTYTAVGAVQREDGPWLNDEIDFTYTNGQRESINLKEPAGGTWMQRYTTMFFVA
jgi:YD repeat-containing protein